MMGKVVVGDCREVMRTMPDASVDSIVTDPPYGLSFMGNGWDHGVPGVEFWVQALRVAKPGANLLAFGGTRTYHRLACAIEDAGWEIRDCIMWVYGSGFPKSLDVSKAIDKAAGVERDDKFEWSSSRRAGPTGNRKCDACGRWLISGSPCQCPRPQDSAQTDAARKWSGWGTALKPAYEPIIVARKPLVGTVAENVLKHGTGGINVDGCRVKGLADRPGTTPASEGTRNSMAGDLPRQDYEPHTAGRWPANLIHDGSDEVVGLFPETGPSRASEAPRGTRPGGFGGVGHASGSSVPNGQQHNDAGGSAARFFYCAKASRADRDAGLDGNTARENHHPTVKPTKLMRYLCRLVTPPGGTVLDPFTGSGSTGRGAVLEGFEFIGVELDKNYADIAEARISDAYAKAGLKCEPNLFTQ